MDQGVDDTWLLDTQLQFRTPWIIDKHMVLFFKCAVSAPTVTSGFGWQEWHLMRHIFKVQLVQSEMLF